MTDYARDGYLFYAVITPSVFLEYELPEDDAALTRREIQKYQELRDLADLHHTYVQATEYRRG
jgi:hypothetical protein